MTDENKLEENTEPIKPYQMTEKDEDLFSTYLTPRRFQPRFWMWVILSIVAVLMVIIFKTTVIEKSISQEELRSGIELFNLDSQWVESEKIDTKEFKGIVLVPQISFRVRNVGHVILHDIYFLGVFRLLDRAKTLGEGFEMALKKPLNPGEESDLIVLTCQFGYRASSKIAFKKNSQEWRNAMVEVFAKTGASKLLPLKVFYISRKIQGLEMDIKLTDKSAEELINPQPQQKPGQEKNGDKSKQ